MHKFYRALLLLPCLVIACNTVPDPAASGGLSVYPNPASEYVSVVESRRGQARLEVFDSDGTLVTSQEMTAPVTFIVPIVDGPSGVYKAYVTINGQTTSTNFIKL